MKNGYFQKLAGEMTLVFSFRSIKSSLLTLKKCPLKSKLLKTLKKLLSLPLILK